MRPQISTCFFLTFSTPSQIFTVALTSRVTIIWQVTKVTLEKYKKQSRDNIENIDTTQCIEQIRNLRYAWEALLGASEQSTSIPG